MKNMGPLQKEIEGMINWDMEKAKVLNNIFGSVFTGKCSSHTAQAAEGKDRNWENEELPTTGED